jgi:uncharacterized membrane protein YecN with MAPEG domain
VPQIIPFYAALLSLIFCLLSVRVIRARRSAKVGIGLGGDAGLERAARVHANFAEYAPLALLLLLMLELQNVLPIILHGLGLALLAGRCVHAWGVSQTMEDFRLRVFGMATTFGVLILASLLLLLPAIL